MTPSRTCRNCLRLATRGMYCDDCTPPEDYDTRKVRKRAQYGATFQRRAKKLRDRARREWKTSRCGICGGRLFDEHGELIGRQLQVHHEYRGSDEHLAVTHSACNESEGEPVSLQDALGNILTPAELFEQAERLDGEGW